MQRKNSPIDVVLVYPRMGIDIGAAVAPPFSLLALAAPLCHKGINVKIIDQRTNSNWDIDLKEALKDNPVCCGISTMTGKQIHFGIKAAEVIRRESAGRVPIVWGGIHPTLLPEQTLRSNYADIICVGEGEETFLDLVYALQNKRPLSEVAGIAFLNGNEYVFTGIRPLIDVEKLLPTPWDLVDVESYINPDIYLKKSKRVLDIGQTSRGCPYHCTFCYSSVIHQHRWRAMSVDKVLDMIEDNVKRFRLDGVWFRDDEFCLDMKRVARICEGIISRGIKISWYTSGARITDILRASDEQLRLLKQSGAYVMRFGAESGSDRVLEFMRKEQTVEQILQLNQKCRAIGIKPVYSLMCGIPTETLDEINMTIDLFFRLQEENPDTSLAPFSQFTAFPGTALYDLAVKKGLKPPQKLKDWADWLNNELDLKGERMPWLSKKERRWLGNLTYLSNISYSAAEILCQVPDKPLSRIINLLCKIISRYFSWRIKRKKYRFVPELPLIIGFSKIYMSLINKNSKKREGN